MHTWNQIYTPILGNLPVSALFAALPVIVLLGLLAYFRTPAHWAAIIGLATAFVIAVFVYGMPAQLATMAALNGAAFGLFPIGWIVLSAIFLYDITVKTGKFEIVKQTIAGLAADRRIQALLIAFSFGAFIEGAAGFGTPVAISAAMLIGLGFKPLHAAGIALIGNTAPVAYGALGTPIITLATITGLPEDKLSAMAGRQLPLFSLIIPFWLVCAMSGWRNMLEVWPACLTAGLSFAIVQFLMSNLHGPMLVDIAAALASIGALVLLLRFWHPKTVWRFADEVNEQVRAIERHSRHDVILAWSPWIILCAVLFLWGYKPTKTILNGGPPKQENSVIFVKVHVPQLDKAVVRTPPVVKQAKAEDAVFNFNWLSATGTGILLSAILSSFVLGIGPMTLLPVFFGTLKRVGFSLLTIAAMLALGYTSRYGGLDATMGLAFASSGALFPFFSPLLGWLGVALTGSDTSSNVLFGNLQQITAERVGVSPILAAASNSTGGVMGKMIDAQSIVVAGVATGQQGGEGTILRYVFFHSLALAALVGLLVLLQAYALPGMIP